jgi:hypothetical protein
MLTSTSDCRQLVPVQEDMALLKSTLHRHDPVDETPTGKGASRQFRPEMGLAAPVQQATPAECYGCVDWFHF